MTDVSSLVANAAQRYGQDPSVLLRIGQIESGLNPSAYNAGSGASGLFQFMPGTAQAYGLADPQDPAANADAAARLMRDNNTSLTKTLGRAPTGAELYLAHQQGAGGAAALLSNPNAPAASIVGTSAVVGNGGSQGMSAGQFSNLWASKYGSAKPSSGGQLGQLYASGSLPPMSTPPPPPQPGSAPLLPRLPPLPSAEIDPSLVMSLGNDPTGSPAASQGASLLQAATLLRQHVAERSLPARVQLALCSHDDIAPAPPRSALEAGDVVGAGPSVDRHGVARFEHLRQIGKASPEVGSARRLISAEYTSRPAPSRCCCWLRGRAYVGRSDGAVVDADTLISAGGNRAALAAPPNWRAATPIT